MISAKFINHYDCNTVDVVTFDICKRSVLSEPDYEVLISNGSTPKYLLKIYLFDESDCFNELKSSEKYVVVGCGEKIHFFNIENRSIKSHELDDYFGHLYPTHDIAAKHVETDILVTSASRLFMFDEEGEIKWVSKRLGIDGVTVHNLETNVICGAGEYDPPEGWKDFKIGIKNGEEAI